MSFNSLLSVNVKTRPTMLNGLCKVQYETRKRLNGSPPANGEVKTVNTQMESEIKDLRIPMATKNAFQFDGSTMITKPNALK